MPPFKTTEYIGADPGGKGGLVALRSDGDICIWKMPERMDELWDIVRVWRSWYRVGRGVCVMVEQVGSMPQQGVKSMFTFGQRYGSLLMAITAAGFVPEFVKPNVWQKALDVPPIEKGPDGKRKKGARRKHKTVILEHAKKLFPKLESWQGTTKTFQLSICDALLIAEYNRRIHEE